MKKNILDYNIYSSPDMILFSMKLEKGFAQTQLDEFSDLTNPGLSDPILW